jgi:hypothetical protein
MKSKIRVRLVWRLVLCLFGHLTLLLILAIYLERSLDSVRSYTPVVRTGDMQLASVDTIPDQRRPADRRALSPDRDESRGRARRPAKPGRARQPVGK